MIDRSTGLERRRMLSARALFVGFLTISVITVACSDSERRIPIGGGANDEGDAGVKPPPTRFDERDASVQNDDGTPNSTIKMCVATECPYPYATCNTGTNSVHACGTNLLTDRNNCGACGNVCPAKSGFPELNMETQCIDGACQRQCVPKDNNVDFRDCNGLVDDGCETNLMGDPDNCGACGKQCTPMADGVRRCIKGQCQCPIGQTWCDLAGCTDLSIDDLNCGACGNQCQGSDAGPPPPHMEYTCQQGLCGQLKCEKGWDDCNNEIPTTGCETDIVTDVKNCGGCGNVCKPGQKCIKRGNAIGCGCEPLETLCTTASGDNYCADLLNDVRNCGACGYSCPSSANLPATCNKGYCEYSCPPGRGDCDGDLRNGCETDLLVNARHCGACGNKCNTAAGQPCVSGKCLMVECDGGETPQ